MEFLKLSAVVWESITKSVNLFICKNVCKRIVYSFPTRNRDKKRKVEKKKKFSTVKMVTDVSPLIFFFPFNFYTS